MVQRARIGSEHRGSLQSGCCANHLRAFRHSELREAAVRFAEYPIDRQLPPRGDYALLVLARNLEENATLYTQAARLLRWSDGRRALSWQESGGDFSANEGLHGWRVERELFVWRRQGSPMNEGVLCSTASSKL